MSIPSLIRRRLQLRLSPQHVAEVIGIPATVVDEVLATGLETLPLATVDKLANLFHFDGVTDLQDFRNDLTGNTAGVGDESSGNSCPAPRSTSRILATLAQWGDWIDTFVLAEQTSTAVDELPAILTSLTDQLVGSGLRISSTESAVRLIADPEIFTEDLDERLHQYRLKALDPTDQAAHYIFQAMHSPDGIRVAAGGGDPVGGLVSGAHFEHQARRVHPSDAVQFSIWDPLAFMLRYED